GSADRWAAVGGGEDHRLRLLVRAGNTSQASAGEYTATCPGVTHFATLQVCVVAEHIGARRSAEGSSPSISAQTEDDMRKNEHCGVTSGRGFCTTASRSPERGCCGWAVRVSPQQLAALRQMV